MIPAGRRTQWITLTEEGDPVPDGDGGFTTPAVALTPSGVMAAIEPASVRNLERVVAGTVTSSATHLVTMPYHPQVSVKTIITFGSKTFKVTGVIDPRMQHRETIATCVEQV